jgi:hypothetical protein
VDTARPRYFGKHNPEDQARGDQSHRLAEIDGKIKETDHYRGEDHSKDLSVVFDLEEAKDRAPTQTPHALGPTPRTELYGRTTEGEGEFDD